MKFLLATLEYPPYKGGIAHYYFNLVKYWPDSLINTPLPLSRGESSEDRTPSRGESSEIEVLDNKNNLLVNDKRKILKWWPAVKTLRSKLKYPDAALPSGVSGSHADNYLLVGHLLPLGTVAWLLSFGLDFKYAVFLHGYDLSVGWAQPRKRWLIKAILQRADKIICANSYTAKQLKKILKTADLGKVGMVNPGIDPMPIIFDEAKIEELKNRYNLAGKTVLLTVTRLVERKGVDMALEGLNLAKKQGLELAYVIIGYGQDEARIRAKIANLGLEDDVVLLTDDSDKMSWYKLADIFIMTARQIGADVEGFGIVYLEAGLAGKPVIAGASGGVGDAVADNVNGLLVDPTDATAISQAIIKLAKYPSLRNRLGDEGRRRALQDFNWEKQAKKIYDLISKSK